MGNAAQWFSGVMCWIWALHVILTGLLEILRTFNDFYSLAASL